MVTSTEQWSARAGNCLVFSFKSLLILLDLSKIIHIYSFDNNDLKRKRKSESVQTVLLAHSSFHPPPLVRALGFCFALENVPPLLGNLMGLSIKEPYPALAMAMGVEGPMAPSSWNLEQNDRKT